MLKILIGLYGHQGRLLINGNDIATINPRTFHARTTACFQDFSKYFVSLRENISFGRVTDTPAGDAAVFDAMTRSGSKPMLEKVRLGALLSPWGMGGGEVADEEQERQADEMGKIYGREIRPLSLGQWQQVGLARAFLKSEEADIIAFE